MRRLSNLLTSCSRLQETGYGPRVLRLAPLLCIVAACSAPSQRTRKADLPPSVVVAADTAPRLVVLLIVDQLPQWSFETKRTALTKGFARLLTEGEWRVGVHPSASTRTASGHALLGTGMPPSGSGILDNSWWNRDDQRQVESTEGADGSVSTRFLKLPGLGDALASHGRGAKAVGIGLKVRGARLVLGHQGLAIAYDHKKGTWFSHGTSVPGATAITWLDDYNRAHPVGKRLATWTPLDPARMPELTSTTDEVRGEAGIKGFDTTFPHDPNVTKAPLEALLALPLGDEMALEIAETALDREQLGTDTATDLLVVSFSAHDYVTHGWGHESWEAWDAELRLDARIGAFLDALDAKVGRGRWALMLTSDHGGAPLPERNNGGRFTYSQVQRAANAAASAVLGNGEWVVSAYFPTVYLSKSALAQPPKELENAKKKILFALRSFPGIAVADRTEAYAGNCDARTGDAKLICLALDPERSGDFVYMPAYGWLVHDNEPLATGHGSPHDYDRRVPVLTLPIGRTPHAPLAVPSGEMSLADVAPLLRTWLGVAPAPPPPR